MLNETLHKTYIAGRIHEKIKKSEMMLIPEKTQASGSDPMRAQEHLYLKALICSLYFLGVAVLSSYKFRHQSKPNPKVRKVINLETLYI